MKQITSAPMVWQFFHERLGLHNSADFRGVCHFREERAVNGAPIGMDDVAVAVAFNGFVGRTCCMHVIVQTRETIPPRVVREAFEYAFLVANCEAVMGLVDSENQAVMRLQERLGFREIARIPNGGLEGDLIVLQMTRSECRWLRRH